ncbi:hypothetical protein Hanom_Chr09g00840011 [Helianthus anomalus]
MSIRQSREERHARMRLDDVYDAYKEATGANIWSEEKECFVDPNGNPTVDPNKFGKEEEDIVDESQNLVEEVKKAESKTEEAIAEKKQVFEEDQIQKVKEVEVPDTEVITQTESSEMLNKIDHKTTEQCKKCMETCRTCTEKDDNLRSKEIEITKIEKIFKEKCHEMLEMK